MDLTKLMLGNKRKNEYSEREFANLYKKHVESYRGLSGVSATTLLENGRVFQELASEVSRNSEHDLEFQPVYEEGGDVVYSDSTITETGTLLSLLTSSVASYGYYKYSQEEGQDQKPIDATDIVGMSLIGTVASFGFLKLARFGESFLEKTVRGVIKLPQDTLQADKKIDLRAKELIKAVNQNEDFKNSGISGTRFRNKLILALNGALLAFHGYQRNKNEGEFEKFIWAGCWGLAGLANLTNLGTAFVSGFGKPLSPEKVAKNQQVRALLEAPAQVEISSEPVPSSAKQISGPVASKPAKKSTKK